MLNYIKENFGDRPSINESERMELDFLRQEVAALRTEVGQKAPGQGAGDSTASDKKRGYDSSSGSGSEEDEDFVGSLPTTMANKHAGPR